LNLNTRAQKYIGIHGCFARAGARRGPLRISRRAWMAALAAVSCRRPRGSGFAGYCFVANGEGRSLAAVDLSSFAVTRQIALEGRPAAVISHPTEPLVYVLGTAGVAEVEARSLKIRRRVRLEGGARAAFEAGGALWVLEERALVKLPLESLKAAARIRLPMAAGGFDVTRDGKMAAVRFAGEGAVAVVNLQERGLRLVALGSAADRVLFRPDGRQLLVGSLAARRLTVVDAAGLEVVVHLPLPIEPDNFCFNSDGGQLFVTGAGMDAVTIVFPYSTEVAETVLAGKGPGAMAVCRSPGGGEYLFVANPEAGDVTVLEIETRKMVAVLQAGREPRHITITPDQQYCLVLNRRSGDLTVIRVAALAARQKKYPAPLFTVIPVGREPLSAAVVRV